jgi:dienelactone hydrolase
MCGWRPVWIVAGLLLSDGIRSPLPASEAALAVDAARPAFEANSRRAVEDLQDHLRDQGLDGVPAQAFATVPLTRDDAAEASRLLLSAHRHSLLEHLGGKFGDGGPRRPQEGLMEIRGRRMRYWYSVRGPRPPGGRSLYLSLHGGGGAPAAVNAAQWENQKRLYAPDEGVYLVPRAPGDTWDLWHQGHVDTFFDRLIRNLVVLEEVDPDRVYLMGYSAGGDGVYQVAPRMADRFAAAAMMAGHPNETRPDGLRNLPFAIWVGAKDGGFGRNSVARKWGDSLEELAAGDPGGYRHELHLVPGKGHWMDGEDAAAVPWLAEHTRNLRPDRVVWLQDDVTHRRFYWLAVSEPRARARLAAARSGQRITITEASPQGRLTIHLDDTMLDLDQPVVVVQGDHEVFRGAVPRTIATLAQTLAEREDPRGLFCGRIVIPLPDS